jgi:competence protein ComQ
VNVQTLSELNRMTDRYFPDGDLNPLLKRFIGRKAEERSIWNELTEYSHRMFGGSSPAIAGMAAVTEMILLSLDIVDDLQDGDNTEVPWMRCPPPHALNAVLGLIFAAVGELERQCGLTADRTVPLIGEVSRLVAASVQGQQKDIAGAVLTEEQYIEMIREKSGSLIRLACYIGYASAGLRDP